MNKCAGILEYEQCQSLAVDVRVMSYFLMPSGAEAQASGRMRHCSNPTKAYNHLTIKIKVVILWGRATYDNAIISSNKQIALCCWHLPDSPPKINCRGNFFSRMTW